MTGSLTERYDDRIVGVLSCYADGREVLALLPAAAATRTIGMVEAGFLDACRDGRDLSIRVRPGVFSHTGSADRSPSARPCRPATAFDFRRRLARGRANAAREGKCWRWSRAICTIRLWICLIASEALYISSSL